MDIKDRNLTDMETYYNILIVAVTRAASDTLPFTKYRKHLKLYWNDQLTTLRHEVIQQRQIWINDGRPRTHNSNSYCNYKLLKKSFRDELRKACDNYVTSVSENIQDSLEFDQKIPWSFINSRKPRTNTLVTIQSNDRVLRSDTDISDEFASHFGNIAKSTNIENNDILLKKLMTIGRMNNNREICHVDKSELSKLLQKLTK